MIPTKRMSQKKNLLLAFDAFGTLFTPKAPVPQQYAVFAERYGIDVSDSQIDMNQTFKKAYKEEAKKNPCYGKAVGMGEEKWWANVRLSDPKYTNYSLSFQRHLSCLWHIKIHTLLFRFPNTKREPNT
jgi:FMN phosphatase YigB (HAD superfamily)